MRIVTVTALLLLTASIAAAEKPNLSGTWRLEGDSQLLEGVWPMVTITQNESELRLSDASSSGAGTITCNTLGKQCEAKLHGDPVKVSYWYNGPVLVEMLQIGKNSDRVIKTRRSLSADGRKMTVEIVQIVPSGRSPVQAVFVLDQSNGR